MADKTDNIKTKLSFDGEAQYKAACKEINSTLKLLNSEMKLVTAEYKSNAEQCRGAESQAGSITQNLRRTKEKGRGNRKSPCKVQRGYRREQRGE